MSGAVIGAVVGGVVGIGLGIAAGVVLAAACATLVACILGVLIAVILIIVAAVLLGSVVGGNIGRAVGEEGEPTGETSEGAMVNLAVGDLVTIRGNFSSNYSPMIVYWVEETDYHGRASADLPQPYSYCEIDEELPPGTEGCIGPE